MPGEDKIRRRNLADSHLSARFINGDEDALQAVLSRFGRYIRGATARKYRGVLNSDEIDDIVLMATFRAWRMRDQFNPERGSLLRWLWGIAQNETRDCLRQSWRQSRLREQLAPSEELEKATALWALQPDRVEPAVSSSQDLDVLRLGLAQLSRRERHVVTETVGNGRRTRDVAEVLGIADSTVRTMRSRALRKLTSLADRAGGTP